MRTARRRVALCADTAHVTGEAVRADIDAAGACPKPEGCKHRSSSGASGNLAAAIGHRQSRSRGTADTRGDMKAGRAAAEARDPRFAKGAHVAPSTLRLAVVGPPFPRLRESPMCLLPTRSALNCKRVWLSLTWGSSHRRRRPLRWWMGRHPAARGSHGVRRSVRQAKRHSRRPQRVPPRSGASAHAAGSGGLLLTLAASNVCSLVLSPRTSSGVSTGGVAALAAKLLRPDYCQ